MKKLLVISMILVSTVLECKSFSSRSRSRGRTFTSRKSSYFRKTKPISVKKVYKTTVVNNNTNNTRLGGGSGLGIVDYFLINSMVNNGNRQQPIIVNNTGTPSTVIEHEQHNVSTVPQNNKYTSWKWGFIITSLLALCVLGAIL